MNASDHCPPTAPGGPSPALQSHRWSAATTALSWLLGSNHIKPPVHELIPQQEMQWWWLVTEWGRQWRGQITRSIWEIWLSGRSTYFDSVYMICYQQMIVLLETSFCIVLVARIHSKRPPNWNNFVVHSYILRRISMWSWLHTPDCLTRSVLSFLCQTYMMVHLINIGDGSYNIYILHGQHRPS